MDIHNPSVPSPISRLLNQNSTGPDWKENGTKMNGTSGISSNTKEKLLRLMKEKDALEEELKGLGRVLDSHGVDMNTPLTTFDAFPRDDIDVAQIRITRSRIIRLRNDYKGLMSQIESLLHKYHAEVQNEQGEERQGQQGEGNEEGQGEGTGEEEHGPQRQGVVAVETAGSASFPAADAESTITATATATATSASAGAGARRGSPPLLPSSPSSSFYASSPAPSSGSLRDELQIPPTLPFASIDQIFPSSPAETAGLKLGDAIVRFGDVHALNHSRLTRVAELVARSEGVPIIVFVQRKKDREEGQEQGQDLRNGDDDNGEMEIARVTLVPGSGWGGRGLLGCHLRPL